MKLRWHIYEPTPGFVQLAHGPENGRHAWYLRVGKFQFDFVW